MQPIINLHLQCIFRDWVRKDQYNHLLKTAHLFYQPFLPSSRMASPLQSVADSLQLQSKSGGGQGVETLMVDNYDSFTYNLVQYLEELGTRVTTVRNDQVTIEQIEAMAPQRIIISPGPGSPKDAGVSMAVIRHFAGKLPIFGVCLGLQCMYEVYGGTVTHAGECSCEKEAQTCSCIGRRRRRRSPQQAIDCIVHASTQASNTQHILWLPLSYPPPPAGEIVHGKASLMSHDGLGIFRGLPSPFKAVRYHSLAGAPETLPPCLTVTARTVVGTGPGYNAGKVTIQGVRHVEYCLEGVQFHPESILTAHGHAMLRNFLAWSGGSWAAQPAALTPAVAASAEAGPEAGRRLVRAA